MKSLTKEQVEQLRNWGDKWPIRAYQWAIWSFPMKQPDFWHKGMAFETIKRLNQYEPRYRLFYSGTNPRIIGYNKILAKKENKEAFKKFLKENGMIETSYERFM